MAYEHAYVLIHAHGETGWTARLIPLTVDGLIWASSMVMLHSAHGGMRVPMLARWLLGLGIAATLAANLAHGLGLQGWGFPEPARLRGDIAVQDAGVRLSDSSATFARRRAVSLVVSGSYSGFGSPGPGHLLSVIE